VSYKRYSIVRNKADGLSRKTWTFKIDTRFTDDDLVLVLDSLRVEERKTKRHKFLLKEPSSYLGTMVCRNRNVLRVEPEVPQDIIDEAIRLVISGIRFERSRKL